jgi:hypothetical protein
MDKSLAKGLTNRIFREHWERVDKKIRELNVDSDWSKNWKKSVKKFSSPWNNFTISASGFGTKKKPWFGFSLPVPYDYNPQGWDEMQYGIRSILLSRNRQELVDCDTLHWTISHHAIQRFLERTNLVDPSSFENAPGLLLKELRYVSLWSLILNTLLINAILEDKNLELYIDNFSLLIPSPHGAFFATKKSFDNKDLGKAGSYFSLRTFLPLKQLNDKQLKIRKMMIKYGETLYDGPIELVFWNSTAIDSYQSNIPISWFKILLEFNSYLDSENFFDEYFNLVASDKFNRSMINKIKPLIHKSSSPLPEDTRKEIFTKKGAPEWLAELLMKKGSK